MRNKISIYTALFIILAAFLVQLNTKKWNTDFGVVRSDVKGYYAYLPLLFVYHDIKIEHPDRYENNNKYRIWYSTAPDGTRYIKFTMGMAMLYAPFFFTAHILAGRIGYPVDGFSLPYQVLLAMSSIFYLIVGIFFLRRMLKLYFNDFIVAVTLVVIYLGTNLFYYYTETMCVSHGYSFAVISLFLYSSIRWLNVPKLRWAVIMGLTGGFMVLIRSVDAVFLFFPLFFKVNSWGSFKKRLKLFRKYSLHPLLFFVLSFLVVLPQLLYWKYITGHFIFYSYTGEHFYFQNPNIIRAVFSFRNGWLVYSPVMLMSVAGLFLVRRRLPDFFTPMIIIIPVYIYVISSWWCWWYVGFGNRAFINLYVLLSIVVATFVQYLATRKKGIRIGGMILITSLILLNLFQTYQMTTGALRWDNMTKAAYRDSFGRLKPSQLFPTFLRKADIKKAKEGVYVIMEPDYKLLFDGYIDFDSVYGLPMTAKYLKKTVSGVSFSGHKSFFSPKGDLYALKVKFPLLDANEIYATVWIKNKKDCFMVLSGADTVSYYKASGEYIKSKNGWKLLNILARFHKEPKPGSLYFYIFNKSKNNIWLDDLQITARKVSYYPVTMDPHIF